MAKRSASKAISKLNKQISNLESKKEIEDKETIPIINKKEINKAKIKQNSVNQKNTSSTNKNIKKATPNKSGSKTSTAKKTKVKNNSSKVSESTQKMLNLEKEMRSLYDRVNDIVEDIEYEKTIIKNQDIILSDIKIKEKEIPHCIRSSFWERESELRIYNWGKQFDLEGAGDGIGLR